MARSSLVGHLGVVSAAVLLSAVAGCAAASEEDASAVPSVETNTLAVANQGQKEHGKKLFARSSCSSRTAPP